MADDNKPNENGKPKEKGKEKEKEPAGGYDDTPVPKRSPGYTLKFTFHRAENLPMSGMFRP